MIVSSKDFSPLREGSGSEMIFLLIIGFSSIFRLRLVGFALNIQPQAKRSKIKFKRKMNFAERALLIFIAFFGVSGFSVNPAPFPMVFITL